MTGLRFAANLKWLFTELPFEARFDAAATAGFTGVEYASPYEHPAARLRQRLDDAGLTQVLINTPSAGPQAPHGAACVPGLEAQFRALIDQALEYAAVLDSGLIHVLGGSRPPDVDPERAFALYVANIAWAAERAAGSGVRLVLEAINQRDTPRFVPTSVEQASSVVAAIGVDRVGVLFDIYHCQVQQGDVTTRLEALLPLIAHVQVADPPSRTEPGTGELNWDFVLGRLASLGYDGWVGCEYTPANGTLEGLGWLDPYWQPRRPDQDGRS